MESICTMIHLKFDMHPVETCHLTSLPGKAETSSKKPKAIVIGAGWAGLASAHALQKAGAEVTLLEAADSVGGLSSAARTKKGRSVEPGIKG